MCPSHDHPVGDDAQEGRRRFLINTVAGVSTVIAGSALAKIAYAMPQDVALPTSVAGVRFPDTPTALAAVELARSTTPPVLFNHSMRVFVFGSLYAHYDQVDFDDELFLVASAFHDFGLLEQYSSKTQVFEMDSADAAKAFLVKRGVSEEKAETVWTSIVMHTSKLARHYPEPIRLVGLGASADLYGGDSVKLPQSQLDAAVEAFPRLGMKVEFQKILTGYCERKPRVQVGSWTDEFCRSHTTGLDLPTIGQSINANSRFKE